MSAGWVDYWRRGWGWLSSKTVERQTSIDADTRYNAIVRPTFARARQRTTQAKAIDRGTT
jgi:hypothetical protein